MDTDNALSDTPVGVALSSLSTSLDDLIEVVEDSGLDTLSVMGVLDAVRGFERVRNRMALIDHRVVADCDRRRVADELSLRNTQAMLSNVIHLSRFEAGRRVRAAAAVGPRTSMVGQPMEPMRPVLAAAQRAGEMTPEQVTAVEESLRDMDNLHVPPAEIDAAEQTLVEYARAFDPRQLTRVGQKLAEIAAPDGPPPDDSVHQAKRHFQMATGRDGAVRGKFCLTPDVGAALSAVLSPLAKPRPDPPTDGGHLADAHRDERRPEQRLHDALGDLCSWALRGYNPSASTSTTTTDSTTTDSTTTDATANDATRSDASASDASTSDATRTDASTSDAAANGPRMSGAGSTDDDDAADTSAVPTDPTEPPVTNAETPLRRPGPPAAPATVIVTVDINDLMNRTGTAETSFGITLTPEQLLRIANEADIYPTVITAAGVPLHLGRTRRIATRAQSMALVARDGGCSFPGCDHPPEWCDRHHITAWIDGGPTDLDNLTLLCRYHHTRFLGKGWACHINTDGVPAWTPPRWQDPTQTPIVHLRILRRQLERQIRERGRQDRPTTPETSERSPTWLEIVTADLRRAQIAREAALSAAARERSRRLGPLWCPEEDEDLNAHPWTAEEIWEAGWRPADPHPERLDWPQDV